MTTLLARAVSENFSSAIDPKKFFTPEQRDEIRRKYGSREHPPIGIPSESCKTNLFFGFFFDGTKNN